MTEPLPSGHEWIATFADALGVPVPDEATVTALLDLAGVAAHSSERFAAPIACWLTATAGIDPTAALTLAKDL